MAERQCVLDGLGRSLGFKPGQQFVRARVLASIDTKEVTRLIDERAPVPAAESRQASFGPSKSSARVSSMP